jgi:hypothetical protein
MRTRLQETRVLTMRDGRRVSAQPRDMVE